MAVVNRRSFQGPLRQRLTQRMETLESLSHGMQPYAQAQAYPLGVEAGGLPELEQILQDKVQHYVTHAQLRGHLEATGRSDRVRSSGAAIELF